MTNTISATAVRTCTGCRTEKPLDAFPRDRTKALGVKARCRDCMKTRRSRAQVRDDELAEERERKRKLEEERANSELSGDLLRTARVEASRSAIVKLILRHRSEFEYLVYAEQMQHGVIPKHARKPDLRWATLSFRNETVDA